MSPTGPLPSPENVHINGNSSIIEWNPPYSSVNNKSDVVHVDPHITHYTVYITDNYTGDVVKVNVTETHFTPDNQQVDDLCLMCNISAWNSGGEGEVSEQAEDNTPRGKQAKDILHRPSHQLLYFYAVGMQTKNFMLGFSPHLVLALLSVSVPRNIIAESITVRGTANVVHIHINNVSSWILLH